MSGTGKTTKEFVVCTEGATSDGRFIEKQWLLQAAKNYDPKKYAARINCEHVRGLAPNGPFNALGDVVSLRTGTNNEGKTTLIAGIEPTDQFKALTKDRQKIYTSCEFSTSFADTNEAYLVGLAATDYPASLGTEVLKFSAKLPDDQKPLAYLKHDPKNVMTETVEQSLSQFADDSGITIFARVKQLLTPVQKKTEQLSTESGDVQAALELLASENAALRAALDQRASSEDVAALGARLDALTASLDQTPAHDFSSRPISTGPAADTIDC
ncbi:GPO family capsid scaffolding protein [Carnimonas bestiolae]|uniref:GPO family capsid scaffolding protein n=1 Tax=Carnimonas bestiolae TaxID=3402172 RepID=UPI003EDB8EAA